MPPPVSVDDRFPKQVLAMLTCKLLMYIDVRDHLVAHSLHTSFSTCSCIVLPRHWTLKRLVFIDTWWFMWGV
jgi:hypothetical protein